MTIQQPTEAPKSPLTDVEKQAIETLDASQPRDRTLLALFHRLAFPEKYSEQRR